MDRFRSLNQAVQKMQASTIPPYWNLVCDYAPGDNALSEMTRSFEAALYNAGITQYRLGQPTYTGNFQTLRCGFDVGLLALGPKTREWPGPHGIYHNVAPRLKQKQGEACGEKFLIGVTHSGKLIIGPNAAYCWSFVRDALVALYDCGRDMGKFQFRSADDFPRRFEHVLRGELDGVVPLERKDWGIPDIPRHTACMIDNYGNVKLTDDVADMPFDDGQQVTIRLAGGRTYQARFARENNFTAGEGNTSFGAGSSRFSYPEKGERRWMEVFIVGGNAANALGIKLGDEVIVEAA